MGPNQTYKLVQQRNQNNRKRQLKNWEKIVVNDAPNKGLYAQLM